MKFQRKIKEFDPSQFGEDPFRDVSPENPNGGGDPWEKIGEILGYVVLGGLLGLVVKIILETVLP